MKKLFGSIAVMAALLMAGGAWGQSQLQSAVDIAKATTGVCSSVVDTDVEGTPTGAYVVGKEWLAELDSSTQQVDLGNARFKACDSPVNDRSNIIYQPACDVGLGTIVEFTITNGEIAQNASYALWDCGQNQPVAQLFSADIGSLNGYTKMRFEFDFDLKYYPQQIINQGTVLVFVPNGAAPGKSNRPTLLFSKNSGLAVGSPMTIQATFATKPAMEIPCLRTNVENLIVVYADPQVTAQVQHRQHGDEKDANYGFDACGVPGYATSTIDVFANPSRAKFKWEGFGSDTPTWTSSQAQILVTDRGKIGPVNQGFCLNSSVKFDLTLFGNQAAIKQGTCGAKYDGVQLAGNNLTLNCDNTWSIASNFGAIDLRDCKGLLITVNGKTPMETAIYPVSLTYTTANQTYPLLDNATAFVWDVNAIKARVAYILIGPDPAFSSFVTIGNRAAYPAEVWIDGVASNNGTHTAVSGKLAGAGSPNPLIPATGVAYFNGIQLQEALKDKNGAPLSAMLWRADLTFYIAVDKDMADVSAQIRNTTSGRTSCHILYNTGNPLDLWRNWQ